jgi:hypothetical protein
MQANRFFKLLLWAGAGALGLVAWSATARDQVPVAAPSAPGVLMAHPPADAPPPLPADCMPSRELRPGMIGTGRTVFQGFKPEDFKVEILGVQRSAMAHGNMIVARLSGKFLENHGVVAGMSGSPVFVNGRNIGAVAYGWSFAYKPYCGITPIEQMWTVWQAIGRKGLTMADQEARGLQRLGLPGDAPLTLTGNGAWDWQRDWQRYRAPLDGKAEPLTSALSFRPDLPEFEGLQGEMRPLASPLLLSGASARTEARLRNWFGAQGFEVMGAGSMAGSADAEVTQREPAPEIEDGSALGIPIVTGDLSLGAIGTVTYRRGDKLIAFGHPMFAQGGVRAPMAAAYIFGFMQSYQRSFKLGETREEMGMVDQDRLFAIGGRFGPRAPRVPVRVKIGGEAAFRPRTYNYSVWNNHDMLPMLASQLINEAYVSSVSEGGKLTARTHYTLTTTDGQRIEKTFFSSDEGGVIDDAGFTLLYDLFLLLKNPFKEGEITGIEVQARIEPGMRADELIALDPEREEYERGETVRLVGRFRPYRGSEYQRVFELRLPERLDPDTYVIHMTDADGTLRVRKAHEPATFNPRSYEDVVRLAQAGTPETEAMHLWLFKPSIDLGVNGQTLTGTPPSLAGVMSATIPDDRQDQPVGQLILDKSYPVPAPVGGSLSVVVRVVDHIDQ